MNEETGTSTYVINSILIRMYKANVPGFRQFDPSKLFRAYGLLHAPGFSMRSTRLCTEDCRLSSSVLSIEVRGSIWGLQNRAVTEIIESK